MDLLINDKKLKTRIVITSSGKFRKSSLRDIIKYRPLLLNLIVRDVKARYKQTLVGGFWAVIQPFLLMVVFTVVFNKFAKIQSNGIPYPVFSYSGLLIWLYFTGSITKASSSFVRNSVLVSKVYVPRIIIPLAATLTNFVDYAIAFTILAGLMLFYGIHFTAGLLLLPFILMLTWMLTFGMSLWFSAINVKYRDIGHIVPIFTRVLMFLTPVIYPTSMAGKYKWALYLNPMSGIIDAHRALILGTGDINTGSLAMSVLLTAVIFVSGIMYFNATERTFADIV